MDLVPVSAPKVPVHLIHGLDGLGAGQRGERPGRAALGVAVVHHTYGGSHALDEQRVVAGGETVVVHLININRADAVHGMDELGFHVPSEVTAIEKAEASELNE